MIEDIPGIPTKLLEDPKSLTDLWAVAQESPNGVEFVGPNSLQEARACRQQGRQRSEQGPPRPLCV